MDSGYRAITEDEGAFVEAGDQIKFKDDEWGDIGRAYVGDSYDEFMFNDEWGFRRPIAQDYYATPTDKIVEQEIKKLYATDVTKPNELLNFIYARLIWQHSEKENYDYMIALRNYIDATSNTADEWPSEKETGEWDGEGLPPAGTECNAVYIENENSTPVTFLGGGKDKVIVLDCGVEDCIDLRIWRLEPIETPAQAEEREREEFKSELANLLAKHKVAIIARHVEKNNIKTAHIGFEYSGQDQIMTSRCHLTGYEIDGVQVGDRLKDKGDE